MTAWLAQFPADHLPSAQRCGCLSTPVGGRMTAWSVNPAGECERSTKLANGVVIASRVDRRAMCFDAWVWVDGSLMHTSEHESARGAMRAAESAERRAAKLRERCIRWN